MATYITRRVLICIPLLFGLLTINFVIIQLAPGDPIDIFTSPDMAPESVALLKEAYGLDKPPIVQYGKYIQAVLVDFEFGASIQKKRPVSDVILDALPNTLILSSLALVLYMAVGILIGIIAAVRQYSWIDSITRVSALTFYSMPSFYIGLLLLFVFSGGILMWLPASGMIDIARYDSMTFMQKVWDRISHFILPCLTLAIGGAASISRYMRGQLLEVIRQDYIRTARAKGLAERTVVLKHGVRNALTPIITLTGLSLPFLMSGSVIVETVFGWPGMGRVAVDAAFMRDYPVFLAANLMFAAVVMAGSLLSDVLYAVADPRVRYS